MMWTKAWLTYSIWATTAGWVLSALGRLDAGGYGVALLALLPPLVCGLRRMRPIVLVPIVRPLRPLRLLPGLFLIVTAVSVLGAVLYDPTNYDFHSYRLPRMLMWLNEGRWHWNMDADWRMNCAGTAQEWLLMPLVALDVPLRLAFLPSLVSFLLLPSLLFRTCKELGVCRRIAWQAMWLVPMASMFVLQAGAVTNDLLGTTYALTALVFAFEHRRVLSRSTFFWCLASAALMSSVKPTNIPLLLPLAVILLPSAGHQLTRPLSTIGTILLAAGLSYLPIMVGNVLFYGNPFYAGTAAVAMEDATGWIAHMIHVLGDLVEGMLALPVNPWASRFQALFADLPVLRHLLDSPMVRVSEILMEEECGPGLALTAWYFWVLARTRREGSARWAIGFPRLSFGVTTLVSTLAFAGIVDSPNNQRLFMPYYVFLLVALLPATGSTRPGFYGKEANRWLRTIVFLSALTSLVMTPARPLWPALSVSRFLRLRAPDSLVVRRMADVYAVYRSRPDALGPVRAALRPEDRIIAFSGIGDDLTTSLWRPFGTRSVVFIPRVALDDESKMRELLITCDVWVANESILHRNVGDVHAWCRSLGYQVESTVEARMKVSDDRTAWCIVRRARSETPTATRTGGSP